MNQSKTMLYLTPVKMAFVWSVKIPKSPVPKLELKLAYKHCEMSFLNNIHTDPPQIL